MRASGTGSKRWSIRNSTPPCSGRGTAGHRRRDGGCAGARIRNGSRTRTLTGTFGKTEITVPRARLQGADGATTEWKSKALRAYQRRTKAADALIARLHDEITADYTDMIYAATPQDIADRRKAFIRKWRLRHKAVADSLEEAGDALFAFAALPPSQWKSARTTNAIERLHEEFKSDCRRRRACALAAVWNGVPMQRCTVHKHRNLLACAPELKLLLKPST